MIFFVLMDKQPTPRDLSAAFGDAPYPLEEHDVREEWLGRQVSIS